MADQQQTPALPATLGTSAAASGAHWSSTIAWRAGRWDPMANAPRDGTEIRVRAAGRQPLEPVKFERNAWRKRGRSVTAEEWQPLRAAVDVEPDLVWPFPIHNAEHRAWLESEQRRVRAQRKVAANA